AAQLQRRAAGRRPLQERRSGDPQPPVGGLGAVEAADRLRQGPHVRTRRRHAANCRQGLPAHAERRRAVGRGPGADARAGLLQPGIGKTLRAANPPVMGGSATFMLLGDAISSAETFVNVFIGLYWLVIFVYILV